MAAILLVGIIAYKQLPVSALPEVDYPTMQIVTFYPGASPEVSASAITAPLERQLGEVPVSTKCSRTSSDGAFGYHATVCLKPQHRCRRAGSSGSYQRRPNVFAGGPPDAACLQQDESADAPIMTLALTSRSMALQDIQDYADTRLAQKISQLSGVGAVTISGGQKKAVRIEANPTQLASYSINLEDIRTALNATSLDLAKGSFDGRVRATRSMRTTNWSTRTITTR